MAWRRVTAEPRREDAPPSSTIERNFSLRACVPVFHHEFSANSSLDIHKRIDAMLFLLRSACRMYSSERVIIHYTMRLTRVIWTFPFEQVLCLAHIIWEVFALARKTVPPHTANCITQSAVLIFAIGTQILYTQNTSIKTRFTIRKAPCIAQHYVHTCPLN